MSKSNVRFKFNKNGMDALEKQINSNLTKDDMEYTCTNCGTKFHPHNGKIICPSCGLEMRPLK